MSKKTRQVADEEDATISALESFFVRVKQGEFPQLTDSTGLWPLLARITVCKAIRQVERESAVKRGGSHVVRESDMAPNGAGSVADLAAIVDATPTAALHYQLNEEAERLLGVLNDETLRRIAILKLEGYENTEIADKLGFGLRSVERKLARIRTLWAEFAE
jgi:DNA-directed RNA polymerase specialized sigma24 family protein